MDERAEGKTWWRGGLRQLSARTLLRDTATFVDVGEGLYLILQRAMLV